MYVYGTIWGPARKLRASCAQGETERPHTDVTRQTHMQSDRERIAVVLGAAAGVHVRRRPSKFCTPVLTTVNCVYSLLYSIKDAQRL